MPETRVADALARMAAHQELHLPLRRSDLLGRLALRFLWRRQLKWQIETNLAVRDGLEAMAEADRDLRSRIERLTGGGELATTQQLRDELESLRQSDQNLVAGLNQRLYSSMGRVQSQLSDLRLQLAETTEQDAAVEQRLKALESQVAELNAAARDVRLRHAQLDLFLDELRSARPGRPDSGVAERVPDRDSFLELAACELLDGPAERVRDWHRSRLPLLTSARDNGVTGPVLDMAPGRGEWLEVLRGAGLPYVAASENSLVRGHCAGLGLTVSEGDPLDLLAGSAQRSLGAVTAFRYVERLEPTALARFVDLAATALQPGGILVAETRAASPDFHLDPFARRPAHPDFLRFLAEAAGFATAEIRQADTVPEVAGRFSLVAWR
ncbi:hypothetical protein [Qaidamihabitans albus]|uniref:hypothetical protein n=1 Tax=Qaidamihabitans albus TaxID=2795733 RepID=UPI0018F16DC9|nr:hypothetical protein [Qaidamihabitans albus]